MTTDKDYYRVLGVLDDAEDIVIKAAYRALAQRYHPDKWKGDAAEANRLMAEINEAYAILSDEEKRAAYDSTREKNRYQDEQDTFDEKTADSGSSAIEGDWAIATKYHPEIQEEADHLRRLSKTLSFSFMLTLIEYKQFNESKAIAKKMRSSWLEKFFGRDQDIVAFALELIYEGRRDAAKELNEAVRVLGGGGERVIAKIAKEFKTKRSFNDKDPEIKKIAKDIIKTISEGDRETKNLLQLGNLLDKYSQLINRKVWYKYRNKPYLFIFTSTVFLFEVELVGNLMESDFISWLRKDAGV